MVGNGPEGGRGSSRGTSEEAIVKMQERDDSGSDQSGRGGTGDCT